MNLGTWLYTRLHGELVGTDAAGNRYYRAKNPPSGRRDRRWVIYAGEDEASKVPAEWHGWLHHRTDATPPADGGARRSWQRGHAANSTGTAGAYLPPGHVLRGARRAPATGDYEPWRPS